MKLITIFFYKTDFNIGFQTSNSHLVNEWPKRARWNELKSMSKDGYDSGFIFSETSRRNVAQKLFITNISAKLYIMIARDDRYNSSKLAGSFRPPSVITFIELHRQGY